MLRLLFKFFCFFIFCTPCSMLLAQKNTPLKVNKKKIEKIQGQLTQLKVYDALDGIDKLLHSDPYHPYYNEYKTNILLQVIEKIKEVKDEDQESIATSYVNSKGEVVQDTVDWVNEADSAMLPPAALEAATPTTKKVEKKKKRKLWSFVDTEDAADEQAASTVVIDSTSIISKSFLEKKESDNPAELTADNIDKSVIATDDGGAPAGFQKSKSKTEKKEEAAAALSNKYYDVFSKMDAKQVQHNLLAHARKSTLYVEYADSSSAALHRYWVDSAFNNKIWKDSLQEFFESAQENFLAGNYEGCIIDCNTAMAAEPTYLPAYWLMADAYQLAGEDSMCKLYYQSVLEIDTLSSATYFHLSQKNFKLGDFDKALHFAIQAIKRYPERTYFDMIARIASKTANDYKSQWIPRLVFPISTTNHGEEIIADEKNPWYYYQQAKQYYASYATQEGIMKSNEFTREIYLEVACVKYMLDSTAAVPELKFARDMRKIGYLDCYVMLSLFHHDLWPQYRHFAAHNADKIDRYFAMQLNWHKEKFREVKKDIKPKQQEDNEENASKAKKKKR